MSTHTTPAKTTTDCDTYPYPSCWQDDARVQVLLAPFRERSVNSENYDSKMKFWQDTIKEYCLVKGKPNFCKQELQKTFTKGQRIPFCLDMVFYEMQKQKLIRLRKEYEYDPENSWTGWAINNFVKKPLNWGFDQIKAKFGALDEAQLGLIEFIHMEVITRYCGELQKILFQAPYSGTLQHFDILQKELSTSLGITEECLQICIHTLFSQRKIGLEYKSNTKDMEIHLVKIPCKEGEDITITETDHAVHNLQVTKNNLLKQLENIEIEVRENESKARQYINENKRLLAKTYLRKKHLLEKNHERRSSALHNIEVLLSNVYEAKLNGVILDAYKFGTKALQNALEVSNLKYDNVDELVSDVRETMESHREIQDSMSKVNLNDSLESLADDELEKELEKIMEESISTPEQNECATENMPQKIKVSDSQLLDMLKGLEIEKDSPGKNASWKLTDS